MARELYIRAGAAGYILRASVLAEARSAHVEKRDAGLEVTRFAEVPVLGEAPSPFLRSRCAANKVALQHRTLLRSEVRLHLLVPKRESLPMG